MSNESRDSRSYRLPSIDALRGLAIVVMALDHVRDFFLAGAEPDPMSDPDVSSALFATRWATHFCAPVFVLLAGVSAGLMRKRRSKRQLFHFLLTRGVWLIVVEWFVISTALTFSPLGMEQFDGKNVVIFQVIWAIGASMIVLSAAQFFGGRTCFTIGMLVICGHNLLDFVWPQSEITQQTWPLWVALHSQMSVAFGPFLVFFQYPLLPWIGVMLLGFGTSAVFELPEQARQRALLRTGLVLTMLFVAVRTLNLYGDPNSWAYHEDGMLHTAMDFLNTTKYPPSLLFLLMTLGPASIACSMIEKVPTRVMAPLITLGRVPFAFYVAHFYLIHLLSVLLGMIQMFPPESFLTHFLFFPDGYGCRLSGVYLVWVLVLLILCPPCRYVAGIKSRRKDWWLSYL